MRLSLLAASISLTLSFPALSAAQEAPDAATQAAESPAPTEVTGASEPAEVPASAADATTAPAAPATAAATAPTLPAAAAATAPTDRIVITPETLQLEEGQIDLEALTKEEELPFFVLEGYYRVRANWVHRADLNFEGPDALRYFAHRLRMEPRLNLNESVVFKAQLDALDDQVWGANPGNVLTQSTADRAPNLIVKRAWFDATTPIGLLSAGRMPSNWGMGLLSNDGNDFKNIFGDAHGGSTFDRVQFGTKPLGADSNWIVAVIYDRLVSTGPVGLVAPENEAPVEEFVGVVFFNTDPLKAGVYQLYRFQKETDTVINATDGYFKLDLGLLYAETEQVWLYGRTKAVPVLNQADFSVSKPEVDIDQYGYAARVGLNVDPYGVEFEWGNATGDRNGFNDFDKDENKPRPEVSNFKFHSDYNVGLLMFEYANAIFAAEALDAQVSGLATLQEQGIVAPEVVEEVLSVSDLALTNGSVTNAFYLNPKLRYSLFDGRLQTTLAYLYATANAPRVVRRQSGTDKYSDYGHEVDLAIDYKYTKNFILGLQAGYLKPGNYFNRQDFITGFIERPENAALVQGRFTVLF